jgi:predicted enzyme related to lactoylglutathione lyase
MSKVHGKFVWYELMTTDTAAAKTFYKKVIGWDAQDMAMPDMTYTRLMVGETGVAGLMALPKAACDAGARPGWTGYVAVDDVDACVAQIKQEGGAVHRAPDDIPGVGRFAIVADPQGAVIALITPSMNEQSQPAPAAPGTPGTAGWRELLAANQESVFGFYSKLFGWTKAEPFDMGAMGIYQLFAWGGESIGGMMTKPDSVPAPFWLYYFNVDGIDAAVARVKDAGGQVINGPHPVPGESWIIECLDPQGAMFALVAPRR